MTDTKCSRLTILSAVLLAVTPPDGLWAQGTTPRPAPGAPLFTGSSFVQARYKSHSTASLYLAQRVGAGMIVAGGVANPETGYRALVVGPGTRLRLGSNATATIVLAGASATDGNSLRLFVIPRMTAGRLAASAQGAVYRHLSGTNRSLVTLDPATVMVRVTGSLRAGVAGVVTARPGRLPERGIGPVAQLKVPGGLLAVELVAYSNRTGPELRGTFNAAL